MPPTGRILILGAGELGLALIDALLAHPRYEPATTTLSLAIRPSTLSSIPSDAPSPSTTNTSTSTTDTRLTHLASLRTTHSIALVALDLVTTPLTTLSTFFAPYTTIIHAGAVTLPPGMQLKITNAVLRARCPEYIPWQWGVDYDAIGPHGGLGLFAEQCEVRAALRSPANTATHNWLVVSCGVFMSFLFEPSWGVVVRDLDGGQVIKVRALGGWDHWLTVTGVRDIARCGAELVLGGAGLRRGVVYIAGETMRYCEFVEVVERVVGRAVERECWTTEWLREQAEREQGEKLWKYRVVFSEGSGLSWPMEETFNHIEGVKMQGVEEWMQENGVQ